MTDGAPHLGARASMLLGLLDSPLTAVEVYDKVVGVAALGDDFLEHVADAAEALCGFRGSSPAVTIRTLDDGGVYGIHLLLRELERHGVLGRLIGDDDIANDLWWRVPPADWPDDLWPRLDDDRHG